jgi:hypothetical protein
VLFRYIQRDHSSNLFHVSSRPPCDPGQSDFPSPVLTVSFPLTVFPKQPKLKCRPIFAPCSLGLPVSLGPCLMVKFNLALCPEITKARHVPKVPLPDRSVTSTGVTASRQRAFALLHRSYGLMRQTNSLLPTSTHLIKQMIFAGCCQSLLGNGPYRHYLCNPCVGAWTPTRGVPPVLRPVSSRRTSASPQTSQVRHTHLPLPCNFHRESISRLQSFHYVQAPTLDRLPGCTHRSLSAGRPGRLHHAPLGWLPTPSCGIAAYPNRVIDTAGISPAGLQPCRLLRRPIDYAFYFEFANWCWATASNRYRIE